MSETVGQSEVPETILFGNAFSFVDGRSDDATVKSFFEERLQRIKTGDAAWLPRTLDADWGFCADLYKGEEIIATLVFDYENRLASVYTTSENGVFGDTTICDQVSLTDAVAAADKFTP